MQFMNAHTDEDQQWIARCFDLARRGIGSVSPNPPVGAVLVYNQKIIGEGFHPYYGGPHAEVVTIQSVADRDRHLIAQATLYVSLEPCCIHGKTPPCTDLIIRENIKDVRVSITDPNQQIAGKGLEILRENNIAITAGILAETGRDLIRMFAKNIHLKKPYVILKWAQSQQLFIGKKNTRVMISDPYTTVWSHNLRASVDAILVGARTVLTDNPKLTTRDAPGRSPHRVVYDPNIQLTKQHHVFNEDCCKVFYFSKIENNDLQGKQIQKHLLYGEHSHVEQMLNVLFANRIGNMLVEGGSHLLGEFIRANEWDEAWVIQSRNELNEGIKAPLINGKLIDQFKSGSDVIVGIKNESTSGEMQKNI